MTAENGVFNRKGSHAGRGFRYQDAVGAWLAAGAWDGSHPYGEIVPEGLDDFELRSKDQLAFVQAKSRRDGVGPFSASEGVKFLAQLWTRHDAATRAPDALILVVERPVAGWQLDDAPDGLGQRLAEEALHGSALQSHFKQDELLAKTRVVVLAAPMEATITRLAAALRCPPLMAQLHYGGLVRRIGDLSDANGVAKVFDGLAVTDIETIIEELRENLAIGDMDKALADGLCETLDFVTPLVDPMFYLGVDVRPGHLAAGLVTERPEARQRIIEALEARRAALVIGPSGAGKSALMWEAARASRHVIRWFRVSRLRPEEVPTLTRFARALRATRSAPVGFVFDDVGRGLISGWNALLPQVLADPGLVMLGSIRQEDAFLLDDRAAVAEIRELGDEELAERIWSELRALGQTTWPGWREPWSRAGGLLLEYAYLLSHGERMGKLLYDQVARRVREDRFDELGVLRVVALAASTGASVDAARLVDAVGLPASRISKALRRLIDEHLIREEDGGRLSGLHQLRSAELTRIAHAVPPPTLAQTARQTVEAVSTQDLELFLGRLFVEHPQLECPLMSGLVQRLEQERDPSALAAALDGLGQAHVVRTIRRWLPEAEAHGIVPTQITATVMLALARGAFDGLDPFKAAIAAGKRLQLRADADLRHDLVRQLSDATLATLVAAATPGELEALLAALVGGAPPSAILSALNARDIDLMALNLDLAVRLAATARLLDRAMVERWVIKAGQDRLLERLHRETPWSTPVSLRVEDGQTVVAGDLRFVAPTVQTALNDDVVSHCEAMLALAPTADLAACDMLDADGELAGVLEAPLGTKRIPRENLPPPALPRWNRRWMQAAAYEVGSESYTAFLDRVHHLLETLVPKLERMFDLLLRNVVDDDLLDEIGAVHEDSRRLTPPREALAGISGGLNGGAIHSTPVQALLFTASSDLMRSFAGLPGDNSVFFLHAKDLTKHIASARAEPWQLIERSPTELFDRLDKLVETLRLLGGEAVARAGKPNQLWLKKAKTARRGNALRFVGFDVRKTVDQRLETVRAKLVTAANAVDVEAHVYVRPDLTQVMPWPTCEALVVVSLEALVGWQAAIETLWPALRDAAEEGRGLWLVPRVGGLVASQLSIGGSGKAFPLPYEVETWLKAERLTLLDDPCARIWSEALNALAEIDGAERFGYGGRERPPIEQTVIAAAKERFASSLAQLELRLEARSPGMFASIMEFCDRVEAGEIELAAGMASILRGGGTWLANQLTLVHHIALSCDILEQLDPPTAAG